MSSTLNTIAQHWFDWQFAMLWQTAVLITIIWMIDLLIRKWAHPQVRYALWMLVLAKLLIPPTFTSPASVTSQIPAAAVRAVPMSIGMMERVNNSPPAKGEYPEGGRGLSVTPASNRQDVGGTLGGIASDEVKAMNTDPIRAATGMERSYNSPPAKGEYSEGGRGLLSWKVYSMFVWLAGIAVLSIWLFFRLTGLRKEHHKSDGWHGQAPLGRGLILPERFYEQLKAAGEKLNLKRLPEVILTDRVSCPAVFGIFRPVLLMPAEKFKTMTTRDTEHILLHELAHIKRGDLIVHAVYMVLQILYWFNPLLWMIRRTLQNLRELCCDATVAKLLKEKTVHYRQTLLETARQLLAEPVDPGLGLLGLFENSNWLVTRLQWLEKNTWKNRPWRIATIILLVFVMTACVLPMANRPKNHDMNSNQVQSWVEDFFKHNYRDITARETLEWGEPVLHENGNVSIRYKYEATIWGKDKIVENKVWTFDKEGKFLHVRKVGAEDIYSLAGAQDLVDDFFANNFRDVTQRKTLEWGDPVKHENGNISIQYKYEATSRDKDKIVQDKVWTFDKDGKFVSAEESTQHAELKTTNLPPGFSPQSPEELEQWTKEAIVQKEKILKQLETSLAEHIEEQKRKGQPVDKNVVEETQLTINGLKALIEQERSRQKEESPNSELPTTNSPFTATLPNGITVELVGVCEHPSTGKQWWKPDGEALDKRPYKKMQTSHTNPGSGRKALEAAVRIDGFEGGIGFQSGIVGAQSSGSCGTGNQKINALSFDQPEDADQTDIHIGIAADPWQTVATQKPDFSGVYSSGDVIWHGPVEKDGGTVLHIAHTLLDKNIRVIAVGLNGKEHTGGSTSAQKEGLESVQLNFDLLLPKIKEFRFQTRPYKWATFKNVSLRPGVKTDVEIEVEKSEAGSQKSEEANIVYGFVTDTLGRPRGNVYIAAALSNLRDAIRTDENGQFTLEVDNTAAGMWVAYSQPTRSVGLFVVPEKYDGRPIHVPLDLKYAEVEGRIVKSDGSGAADRQVELTITTNKGITYQSQCYRKTDEYGYYTSSIPCGAGLTVQARLEDAAEDEQDYKSQIVALKDKQIHVEIPIFVLGQGQPNTSDDGRVHYSGRVLNEQGEPIEGVEVKLHYQMPGNMGIWGKEIMTDEQGRWNCRIEKSHANLYVRLIHPEYQSFHFDGDSRTPSVQELIAGTNVMTLNRGYPLVGIVKDEQGKPLDDALVAAGRLYARSSYGELHEDATAARTAGDGSFRIGGLPEKKIDVMISAPGYAPKIEPVEIKKDMKPIDVVLEKGITYSDQVVNINGNPLPGVEIDIGEWRIGNERHSLTRLTETDSQGHFTINNLPREGTIRLDFGKRESGLLGFSKEMPKDSSGTDRIVMYKTPVFAGRVVDAETGEPITNFEIIHGIKSKDWGDSINWSRYYKEQINSDDGRFNQTWQGYHITSPFEGACYLKIQANGYLPEATPPVKLGKDYEPFVIKLSKAQIQKGMVVDNQGKPAVNAQIGWVGPEQKAFIKEGKFDPTSFTRQTDAIVATNSEGQFELQPNKEQGLIVVLHENGYATLLSSDFETGNQIQLIPWAKINGTVIDNNTANNEYEISVNPITSNESESQKISWRFNSISISQPKFSINYIPSIPLYIGKVVRWEQTGPVYLNPQPGQTYEIQIGGKGQTVTGKILFPKTEESLNFSYAMANPRQVHAAAYRIMPEPEMPAEISGKTRSSFVWQWRDAKNVYERSKTFQKRFMPTIEKTGEFRFDHLPSGSYEFVINVHAPLDENVSCGRGVLKATSVVEFKVDKQDDSQAIRIPDISLTVWEYPKVQEQAPYFQAKTFEGKNVDLQQLRGKVVLLDFWATWCSPCLDQIPKLRDIYDTFGNDQRFEMISLSVDWDIEKAKQVIREKKLQWCQVTLGDMSESSVVRDYGVGAIPAMILIDVDGKILADNTNKEDLKPVIQQALAQTASLRPGGKTEEEK